MNSNGKYGTIVNWIVGNEVNNYNDYNYLGKLSFNEYIDAYTRSFRVVSMALRSVYSKARALYFSGSSVEYPAASWKMLYIQVYTGCICKTSEAGG